MSEQRRRGPMGGHGRMMSGEKAKDFKGSMAKLFRYMGRYKFRFILMFIFAVAGTVFSIVGPKILGKATTELFNGLVAKVNGTGEIDFGKIGMILLWTLGLYVLSACFSFVQGFVMSGISNDVTYNLRKDISKKINRLPLNYYESRTNGEILSRITNDVDTLQSAQIEILYHEPHHSFHPDTHPDSLISQVTAAHKHFLHLPEPLAFLQ